MNIGRGVNIGCDRCFYIATPALMKTFLKDILKLLDIVKFWECKQFFLKLGKVIIWLKEEDIWFSADEKRIIFIDLGKMFSGGWIWR